MTTNNGFKKKVVFRSKLFSSLPLSHDTARTQMTNFSSGSISGMKLYGQYVLGPCTCLRIAASLTFSMCYLGVWLRHLLRSPHLLLVLGPDVWGRLLRGLLKVIKNLYPSPPQHYYFCGFYIVFFIFSGSPGVMHFFTFFSISREI